MKEKITQSERKSKIALIILLTILMQIFMPILTNTSKVDAVSITSWSVGTQINYGDVIEASSSNKFCYYGTGKENQATGTNSSLIKPSKLKIYNRGGTLYFAFQADSDLNPRPVIAAKSYAGIEIVGGGGSSSDKFYFKGYGTASITDVSIDKTTSELRVGSSEQLTATVEMPNAPDTSVTWDSSNTSVANVDSTGNVTAVGLGTATITVRSNADNSKSATCTVTVTAPTVTSTVTLNTNDGTINSGNITEYEEGTGATLPTDVTKDGYTFDGWYDNEDKKVTVISASDTGNKEYWAKWTPNASYSINENLTYNGEEQIGITYNNETTAITGTYKATNVGNYTATLTPKTGYTWSNGTTDARVVNWSISPINISDDIIKFEDETVEYDGDAHAIKITGNLNNGTIKYGTTEGTYDLDELPTYTDAGTYTIYYKASKDNYNVKAGSATLTITKKPITFEVTDKESVYGDEIADLAYSVTSGNVVNGDNLGITYKTYNGETEVILGTTTAVGTYTIKATSTNTNYNVTFVDGTYTINKKAVTPDVTLSQDTFTYNKEEQKPTVYVKVNNADLPTTEYTKEFTTDSTNVGSKKVTITSKNQNYTFEPIEKTYMINAKTIDSSMVTIEDSQYVFDNTDKTPTVTLKDGDYTLVENTDYEILDTSTTTAKNYGNYNIIVKGKGNYKDEYTITWAITKKQINGVTINGVNTVYDGTNKEIDVTIPTGAKIKYKTDAQGEYSETKPTFKDAGNYTVYYKIEIDENYDVIENSVPVIITPKNVTVTVNDKEKTYGEEDEALTYTAEGLIGNETLKGITLSREVGEDVGEYTITATEDTTKDTNYNIAIQNGTYTVNKKTITEEEIKEIVSIENQLYTGEKVEPEIVIKDGEKIVLSSEYTVKYSDNIKPGIAKVTIKNAEGGNYTVETTELTFVIIDPGKVEFIEHETSNANNAKVTETAEEIIAKIELTEEDVDNIKHGKNLDVYLEVKDISNSISSSDKKAIEEKLGNSTIGLYLDINLFKQVEGQDATIITETKKPITISFELPDELINNNSKVERTYKILRLHDGLVDELEVKVDGKTATFETDKFSTYALTYTDTSLETSSSPKTGDHIIVYVVMFIVSLLGIRTLSVSNKRKSKRTK